MVIEILKKTAYGKNSNSNCNKIYITDDNPRNENPTKIRNEIIKNIKIKDVIILEIELKQSKLLF